MAEKHCSAALTQAKTIETQFNKVFTLFGQCHKLYDSKYLTDADINSLGKSNTCKFCSPLEHTQIIFSDKKIKEFMKFYRENFPWASVLPKMHMLEEHVIPWLRRWHVGFGLMGEQGAESIHAYFNSLKRTYHGVPDPVNKLRLMMHEHLLHIAPANVAAKPIVKKQKTNGTPQEQTS